MAAVSTDASPAFAACASITMDAVHRIREARFGHHPDPATDFIIEVEAIEAEIIDQRAGLPVQFDVADRIRRAMDFRVGGDRASVSAKADLRRMEMLIAGRVPDDSCAAISRNRAALGPVELGEQA